MTRTQLAEKYPAWAEYVEKFFANRNAVRNLVVPETDRAAILREALRIPGGDRAAALYVFPSIPEKEKLQVFDSLIFLASAVHGVVLKVREYILSLPRDWVLERIDAAIEPYLANGTYDEYRRFLELFERLDPSRILPLARRAAAHADPDIREAGEEYIERFGSQGVSVPVYGPTATGIPSQPAFAAH